MAVRIYAAVALAAVVLSWFHPGLSPFVNAAVMVWLLGTQNLFRGFILAVAITFVFQHTLSPPALAAAFVGLVPFLADRVIRRRLPGFLSTLFLPATGVIVAAAATQFLLIGSSQSPLWLTFWALWFGSMVNWMWDTECDPVPAVAFSIGTLLLASAGLTARMHATEPASLRAGAAGVCGTAACALAVLAALRQGAHQGTLRPQTIALLRSPADGSPLRLSANAGRQMLISASGERFPVVGGVPRFIKPSDVTGLNKKYAQLYDTIAGFYDTGERFMGALFYGGEHVHRQFLKDLDIRAGDVVLETSIGTGLNLRYLPRTASFIGVDISLGMLRACQENLRRWGLSADLLHANAEALPLAGDSCDVVFHVGGINFFSDKRQAILEMIRVAKPGSRILIADETEKHAKTYEKNPLTRAHFKNRTEPVAPITDLVPPGMVDLRLETVWKGRFYVVTFRKPDRTRS